MRVLSIDGGGIRGIIPARLLVALEQNTGRHVSDLFDLLVGTSTGGILAMGLAVPGEHGQPRYEAADLLDLYARYGSEIFPGGGPPSTQQRVFGPRGFRGLFNKQNYLGPAQRIGAISGGNPRFAGNARYFPDGLDRILTQYFGDTRLGSALVEVMVTSYDMKSSSPYLFKASEAREAPDGGSLMRDVARATSAGPTFFPPFPMTIAGQDRIFIDGGVAANNPSMIGYTEAVQSAPDPQGILVVSLGTGTRTEPDPADVTFATVSSRSWLRVAAGLMTTVFDGTSVAQDQMLRGLLDIAGRPPRYWRFQADLGPCNFAMDDASPGNIACLERTAEELVHERAVDIQAVCDVVTRT